MRHTSHTINGQLACRLFSVRSSSRPTNLFAYDNSLKDCCIAGNRRQALHSCWAHLPIYRLSAGSALSKFLAQDQEHRLILIGTDYDNEGKPIAYFGKEGWRAEVCGDSVPDARWPDQR
jgi:hypothetical protein